MGPKKKRFFSLHFYVENLKTKKKITHAQCQDSCSEWHACICVGNLLNCLKCPSFDRQLRRFHQLHSFPSPVYWLKMEYCTGCRWLAAFLLLLLLCTNTSPNHLLNHVKYCDLVDPISMCHGRIVDVAKSKFSNIQKKYIHISMNSKSNHINCTMLIGSGWIIWSIAKFLVLNCWKTTTSDVKYWNISHELWQWKIVLRREIELMPAYNSEFGD